jgi:hypothetical protein
MRNVLKTRELVGRFPTGMPLTVPQDSENSFIQIFYRLKGNKDEKSR